MLQHVQAIFEDGVLKPLQPVHLIEHQRVRVSIASEASDLGEESFYDAASRLGFVGCISGTPSDLSTNKKYMEGFGKRDS